MTSQSTADDAAAELVVVGSPVPGGGFYVVLNTPGGDAVHLGPYQNRDVAKDDVARVRVFVAAVIRQAQPAAPPSGPLVAA